MTPNTPGLAISEPLQALRPMPGHRPNYGTESIATRVEGEE